MTKTEEELSKLKVAELKEILKEKDLSVSGKKADLIQRLLEAYEEEQLLAEEEETTTAPVVEEEEKTEPAVATKPAVVATTTTATISTPTATTTSTTTTTTAAASSSATSTTDNEPKTKYEEQVVAELATYGLKKEDITELSFAKMARAKKFGTDAEDKEKFAWLKLTLEEQTKRLKRMAKFGTKDNLLEQYKRSLTTEKKKIQKKQAKSNLNAQLQLRKERFKSEAQKQADKMKAELEEQKRKRAERFS